MQVACVHNRSIAGNMLMRYQAIRQKDSAIG